MLIHFKNFVELFFTIFKDSGCNDMDFLSFEDINEGKLFFDGIKELSYDFLIFFGQILSILGCF